MLRRMPPGRWLDKGRFRLGMTQIQEGKSLYFWVPFRVAAVLPFWRHKPLVDCQKRRANLFPQIALNVHMGPWPTAS